MGSGPFGPWLQLRHRQSRMPSSDSAGMQASYLPIAPFFTAAKLVDVQCKGTRAQAPLPLRPSRSSICASLAAIVFVLMANVVVMCGAQPVGVIANTFYESRVVLGATV